MPFFASSSGLSTEGTAAAKSKKVTPSVLYPVPATKPLMRVPSPDETHTVLMAVSQNALLPMLVTLEGIVIVARAVQFENAALPMVVTVFGRVTLVMLPKPASCRMMYIPSALRL